MDWYKCHTSLRKNAIYKRLSPLARQAFRNAMDTVADYEQGDKLALRIGKLSQKELSDELLVPLRALPKVLQELRDCGFFTLDSDGIWRIVKFTEKTESHAERQRRYRENHPENKLSRRLREYRLTHADFFSMLRSQQNNCNYCGIQINEENCAIDHVLPLVAGGATERTNLQLLCIPCNGGKSGMTGVALEDFIKRRGLLNSPGLTGSDDEGRVTGSDDARKVTGSRDGYRGRDKREELPNGNGGVTPQQPNLPSQEPSDLAAWLILDAAWESISARHDLAVKRKDWRSHNKRAAKALADNGKTPEQVTAMLALAYTHPDGKRFYGGITTLAKLTEHWPKLAALENEPEEDEAEIRKAIMRGDYLPIC